MSHYKGRLHAFAANIRLVTKITRHKHSSGLYYKHVAIVNYASSGVNKLRASLNDDARVIIYDHHMFIVQDTAYCCPPPFGGEEEKKCFIRLEPGLPWKCGYA